MSANSKIKDPLLASIGHIIRKFPIKSPEHDELQRTIQMVVGMVRERQRSSEAKALVGKFSEIGFHLSDPGWLPSAPELFELVSQNENYYPSKIDERLIKQIGKQRLHLLAGKRVLEVGCGSGRVLRLLINAVIKQPAWGGPWPQTISDMVSRLPNSIYFNDISSEYCELARELTLPLLRIKNERLGTGQIHTINRDYKSDAFLKCDFFVQSGDPRLIIWGGLGNCNETQSEFENLINKWSKRLVRGDGLLFFKDYNENVVSLAKAYDNVPTRALMWSLFDTYRQLLGCVDPQTYNFDLVIDYNDLTNCVEVVFVSQSDHCWQRRHPDYGVPVAFKKNERILGPFSVKGPSLLKKPSDAGDDLKLMQESLNGMGFEFDITQLAFASRPEGAWRDSVDPNNLMAILCFKK